jgi:hypothetical protein
MLSGGGQIAHAEGAGKRGLELRNPGLESSQTLAGVMILGFFDFEHFHYSALGGQPSSDNDATGGNLSPPGLRCAILASGNMKE